VTDLDKVSAEKDAAVTELTARITALETDVAAAGEQLEQARAAAQEAVREASVALTRLAAAEARSVTLQQAHDALLDRVAPAAPGTDPGARPAPGGKD
jgi:chromosome segregation ATPase